MKHCATTRVIAILVGLLLGIGGAGSSSSQAQDLSSDERDRLAPRLWSLADGEVADRLDPLLQPSPPASQGDTSRAERYSVIVHTGDPASLRQNGIRVQSDLGGIVTADVTPAELRTLASLGAVTYVEPARRYEPTNDVVRGLTGAASLQEGALGSSYTGQDVIACVIDTGIDWAHRDFRGVADTTSSRILALWDQTLTANGSEQSPEGFDFGVEYTRSDIERELRGATNGAIRQVDTDGHGTHVAGTLAGNGAAGPSQRYRGMAPEADIVAVKTDFVHVIDGLTYCGQVADEANRPVVVNLSLGRSSGPHDGTAPLAQAIDDFVGPGRAVVAAAGNGGNKQGHASRSVAGGDQEHIQIEVPGYTPADGAGNDVAFSFDGWISGDESLSIEVVTPRGDTIAVARDTAAVVSTSAGALAYENTVHPSNGDRTVELAAYDAEANHPPAEGRWRIRLDNESSSAATVHGWLAQSSTGSAVVGGDGQYTVGPPATARQSISVGGWTQRWRWQDATGTVWSGADIDGVTDRTGRIARFSSRGPLRGGREKPDLAAPGHWTASSLSSEASVPSRLELSGGAHALLRGTSMAAPVVAGAAALLFQHDPSLTGERAKQLLTESTRTDDYTGSAWTESWGHGKLDVFQAMAALQGKPVRERSLIAYDAPSAEADRTVHTLGGAGADRVAVRFTPDASGHVQGLVLQTASGDARRLNGSLIVEIRSDEEGEPGRRLGAPVDVSSEALASHTSSFISLHAADVSVEAGTNYHVVVRPQSPSGELDLAGETASIDGRSQVRENGEWTPAGADLGLRVTTGVSLDLQAPSLAGQSEASIVMDSNAPTLEWEAVPDAERYTLQISSRSDFSEEHTRTLTVDGTSHTVEGLASSTSYSWRVRAMGQGHSGPWSSAQSFLYYPSSIDVRASHSFKSTETASGYRLVALPGDQEVPVASTLEGTNGPDWRVFWDNGQANEYLVEFDQSSTFHFRDGNGFWLISGSEWAVNQSVSSVPLREDGTHAIDLHEGWNIISNPFDLGVPWSMVEAANGGDLQEPWRFAGGYSQVSTLPSAQGGEAFYFFNDRGLEELVLPYPEAPQAPAGEEAKQEGASLRLTTHREEQRTSVLRAGVAAEAEEGLDAFDQVAPPGNFEQASLRLQTPSEEAGPRRQQLAVEYRPAEAEGHTFSLTLAAEPGPPVEIQAEGMQAFEGQQVVLVNPSTARSYDLRATPTVSLQPDSESQSLRLLIGDEAYVETQKQATLPTEIRFPPNYPNPFGEQTTLEYTLPEPATVRLAVYDVLGRQVDMLVDERQQAGVHTVQWDGRDEGGRRVASGLYLARLVVEGTTKVRKMTLVR